MDRNERKDYRPKTRRRHLSKSMNQTTVTDNRESDAKNSLPDTDNQSDNDKMIDDSNGTENTSRDLESFAKPNVETAKILAKTREVILMKNGKNSPNFDVGAASSGSKKSSRQNGNAGAKNDNNRDRNNSNSNNINVNNLNLQIVQNNGYNSNNPQNPMTSQANSLQIMISNSAIDQASPSQSSKNANVKPLSNLMEDMQPLSGDPLKKRLEDINQLARAEKEQKKKDVLEQNKIDGNKNNKNTEQNQPILKVQTHPPHASQDFDPRQVPTSNNYESWIEQVANESEVDDSEKKFPFIDRWMKSSKFEKGGKNTSSDSKNDNNDDEMNDKNPTKPTKPPKTSQVQVAVNKNKQTAQDPNPNDIIPEINYENWIQETFDNEVDDGKKKFPFLDRWIDSSNFVGFDADGDPNDNKVIGKLSSNINPRSMSSRLRRNVEKKQLINAERKRAEMVARKSGQDLLADMGKSLYAQREGFAEFSHWSGRVGLFECVNDSSISKF